MVTRLKVIEYSTNNKPSSNMNLDERKRIIQFNQGKAMP